jgi:hypothetical protein
MWTIVKSKSIVWEAADFWSDHIVHGVLSIEENEWGEQRARITDGVHSWRRDVAWAWEQFAE